MPLLAQWGNPVTLDVSPDWRVAAFAAALGIGARRPSGSFRLPRRSGGGSRRRWPTPDVARRAAADVHWCGARWSSASSRLSLALVVVAMLLVRTLHNLRTLPTGFDIDHLAVIEVDPEAAQ